MIKFKKLINLRKLCPIYINTLNIFRPFKTWWKNRDAIRFPKIEFTFHFENFEWLKKFIYTWYWWDHPYIYDFKHKLILILIDDVQYKYTYGIRELESVPFIIIRLFGFNFIWKFTSPKYENIYEYWENIKESS